MVWCHAIAGTLVMERNAVFRRHMHVHVTCEVRHEHGSTHVDKIDKTFPLWR